MKLPEPIPWDLRADSSEIVERYSKLATCQISDSLHELGLPREGLFGIEPIDVTSRIAGPAFTVQCRPATETPGRRIEYLQAIPTGAVVVIDNGGRVDCSVWGGQRTLAARQCGAVGAVVHGAFRDIPEHLGMSFPVFGLQRTVVGSADVANPVHYQQPIEVAGVAVRPGDLVVGDASGVVVIPAEHVLAVLANAEPSALAEQHVVDAVAAGRNYFDAKKEFRDGRQPDDDR